MKKAIRDHLSADPVLRPLIRDVELRPKGEEESVYEHLLRAIVGQQLSVKAASAVFGRFESLLEGDFSPNKLLQKTDEDLRSAGLSRQKTSYLKNVARFALEEDLSRSAVENLSDEELIEKLTSIKGIGRWTVEMMLIFALGREDVFPVDDLGVRTAVIELYGIPNDSPKDKRILKKRVREAAAPWSPYRSYASVLLWKYKDNAPA